MKVKDLIKILESLNDDDEVFFLPTNSHYPEDFSGDVRRDVEIYGFWGKDFKGALLKSDGQVGGC